MQHNDAQEDSNNETPRGEAISPSTEPTTLPNASAGISSKSMEDKALRMMQKMGYKVGSGLGKNEQGITEIIKINTNLGKRGLGLNLKQLNLSDQSWDFTKEELLIEEKVKWLENCNNISYSEKDLENWIKEGPPNHDVIGNASFCDKNVLESVFKAKDIFDKLDVTELTQARGRANPFETIRAVFFMNRAAVKMANIDAATDFMFTTMEKNTNFASNKSPIYFADVCAGPGGFTEYILWRKQWLYKGFGLTLKDGLHDFKVSDSLCIASAPFQALYGSKGDGDICNPSNLSDFIDRVKNETEGQGLHFMMSDGGFSVDGQENLQEILSKNIYICQCLLALKILRPHGCFVTKLFDVFTPFSVGLLFLVYLCFEKVGIIKPNTSRPANSERYFVCSNLKINPLTNLIRDYLWKIVIRLWEIKTLPDRDNSNQDNLDLLEIVPLKILEDDERFFNYIWEMNTVIGRRQIIALEKLGQFCRNPSLIDVRQDELRKLCLDYWKIPDEKKKSPAICNVRQVLAQIDFTQEVLKTVPRFIHCKENLETSIGNPGDWHYTYLFSSENANRLNFYAGVAYSKVFRLQTDKWVKIKYLDILPGTLLYGELVKETSISENNEASYRYSLQVIDAVFLGTKNLQKYTFHERNELIQIFCKSVNKESQENYTVRVRPKVYKELGFLPRDEYLSNDGRDENFIMTLPRIGYKSVVERCDINSILLLKTNKCQSFQSTHILKIQIFTTKEIGNVQRISFNQVKEALQDLST